MSKAVMNMYIGGEVISSPIPHSESRVVRELVSVQLANAAIYGRSAGFWTRDPDHKPEPSGWFGM